MVRLSRPRRALPCCCAITREYPAHSGAATLVPPQQHWICATLLTSAPMKTPGYDAIIATSGTSRAESLGTPRAVCQAGVGKILLAPPPLDPHAVSIPPGAAPTTL